MPGGRWHGILDPSRLATGNGTQEAGSVEKEMVTERMSEGSGRAEVKRRIIQRSIEDDAFRQRLLKNPKAAIEEGSGIQLPEGIEIRAVEETPDTVYILLPGRPADVRAGELSDRELESVAGGSGDEWSAGWGPC